MPKVVVDNSEFPPPVELWRQRLLLNERGKPRDCRENIFLILEHHREWNGVIAYDDFSNRVVKRKAPPYERGEVGVWSGIDDLRLGHWMGAVEGIVLRSTQALIDAVALCASNHIFHPVREWLDGLTWDGTPRREDWLADGLGVELGDKAEYVRAVGRYFLGNLVARIYEPGCIMRSVPVLEGAQERGKSTALRRLVGDEWFSDTHFDVGSKDSYQAIQGVWLYEISEMSSFNKSEAARVKEFVSSVADNFRPPYERRNVKVMRQVCFAGTTNEAIYLKDWTGNTRFWPITTGEIDLQWIADQREQLFAEAVHYFRKGERRYPTREETARLFEPEQEARELQHPWQPMIHDWLDAPDSCGMRRAEVTIGDVLQDCLKFERSKLLDSHGVTVGRIMSRLGWTRKRKSGGAREWFYERPAQADAGSETDNEVPL